MIDKDTQTWKPFVYTVFWTGLAYSKACRTLIER